jgi:hypothetical protein
MGMNSVKFNEEKSQSWVLALEALAVGIFLGYQASNSGVADAGAFAIGVGSAIAFYALLVLVNIVFWIWTLALAGIASFYVHAWLIAEGVERGWSLVWTVFTCLVIVGLHMKSRVHSYAEDFGPRVTRVRSRN